MKTNTLLLRRALLFCVFLFGIFGVSWGQVTYTLGNTGYYTIFTDGTAGAFANSGTAELGMYANGGNKQVVAWRNFNIAGDNSGSNRNLQVGDVFTIQVNATAAFGSMGFSLNATPSTGSWANRHSNSRLYIQADGTTGSWYVNSSAGNQSLNYNVSTTARDYQFRIYITSLTTCDVELYVGGSFHSRLPNLTMNGSSGANISHFVLYLNDDYNGANNTNIHWKQTTTHNASGTVNLGYYLPSGTYTPGLIQNGLTSNSTSTSNTNVVNVGGDAGSSVFLNQANTYTGLTTVNANATLKFGASSSSSASGPVGTTGAGTTVTSGGVLDMNGFSLTSTATEALTINGTGISSGGALINTSGTGSTWTGTVALAADASIGGSGNISLNGAISGANNLTKVGAGTLTLGATNTFGGVGKSITVAAGTVAITSFTNNLGDASNIFTLGSASTAGTLDATPSVSGNVSRSFTVAQGGGTLKNSGSNTPTFITSSGTYTGTLNGELTVNCAISGDIQFNLGISGAGGITVNSSGTGKLIMGTSGAVAATYTGDTKLTAGSLELGIADMLPNSSRLVLNGGTFRSGATTGRSETMGPLQLTANSTIALGTGSHTLTFSASNLQTWTAGRTLTITGWSGSAGASGSAGKIFVGSSSSGLTASQLSQISFDGFGEATILSTGEVVPKPAIYRSAQSGNWGNISTWQSSSDNGLTWVNATVAPGSDVNTTITIQNNHTVSQNNNYSIGSSNTIVINAGGTLNMTSAPTTDMQFSSMTVNGTLVRNYTDTYVGAITIGNGGKYIHAINGGTVPSCTWNSGSTFEVTGITIGTSFSAGSLQSFHHVIWNCTNQSSIFNFGGLTTVNGDFTVQSTGASPSTTSCLLLTNSTAITTTIAGNLTISGGFFAPFGASTASSSTLNISGNLSISGGTFDIYRPSSNTGTINLAGDFSMTGGTLTKGGSGTGNFNFSKNGTQTYSKSSGTISNAINFTVNSGSTLSMGTNILDGSTGTFTLSSGAGLITANTAGITSTGSTGTIQVSGARTYNIGANYTFNGSSAQVTGAGFSGANNLTINNSAGVTLSGNASLAGTLTLTSGAFTVGSGNTITVSNGGAISRTSGSLAAGSGAGTFTFSGTGTVTGTVGFNNVNIAGGVNFGSSGASTINGTLTINSGGFVNTNAPIYASGSTLRYNSGGTYGRGTEWSATSGAGYPHHVQISNLTTLNLGANSGTSTTRQIAGDLTIDANSTLTMNALNEVMTAELIVKGNYINNGTTNLSGTIGGDLVLEGDLTDNNAFNANGRAIFFRGNNTQSITSNSDPLDIDVARVEKSGGEIVLGQNLLVDETANPIQFAGTLSVLNLNGYTATFGKTGTASQITMNSTSAIKGSASSTLTILGTGSFGTLRFDQTTPGTTNVLGTLTVNRTNTGSVTLSNNLQIATSLVLTDGTLSLEANTLAINGSVSRTSGTINASSGTVAFGNASNLSLPTSLFTGNVANISKTGGAGTVTLNDNLTITGNLTTTASTGAFIVATSKELTINGTLTNNGTFTLKDGATLDPGTSYSQSVGGTYNVEQVVSGAGGSTPNGRGWYIGSPVSGATSNVFNPQNSTDLLYHWSANQTTPAWAQINAGSGSALEVGKGYLIRMGATSTTLNFSSNTLNNGAINIPCYRQASATFQGYNLISNPYPSYLNWASIYAANSSSFEDKIWYRIGNASNAMVFDTYAGGVGTSNYGGQPVSGYIPPMQAVWVRLNSSITPGTSATNLTLNNEMRSHYAGGAGAGLKSTIQDFPMFVRLNLLQDNKKDQVLVYMRPEAQHLIDAYDAEKMFLTNYPQIYTKINDKKLVINAMKNNKTQTIVPLFLELPSAGVYTLNTEEFNIENGLILLEDKQEGVIQDMTFNENYVFYGNSGLLANRFFIHFKLPAPIITATGPSNNWVDSESENEWSEILISTNGKGKILVSQDTEQTYNVKSFITITDASGKLVLQDDFEGANGAFELVDVVNGVYFVRVESNGQIAVKKVLVQF